MILLLPQAIFYIIIGIVQGILEWLPISSEGQIIYISTSFFDLTTDVALRLAIWLHFGTLMAVLFWYRDDWKDMIQMKEEKRHLIELIIISTLGTALVSLPIRVLFLERITSASGAVFLLLMGIALLFTTYMLRWGENDEFHSLSELSKKQMFIIGMFQGLAIIPGVSRSGTTIGAFLLLKTEKNEAMKGSFLISVPAVLGAVSVEILLAIIDKESLTTDLEVWGIFVAIVISLIFGIITINSMLELVKRVDFSIVTLILAVFFIIAFLIESK